MISKLGPGMFVQEHVGQMLTIDIPDGWEEAMAAAEEAGAQKEGKHGRRRKRVRKSKKGMFGSDEDDEGDAEETPDEDAEVQNKGGTIRVVVDGAENSRRETRGVVLPENSIPFEGDNSDDEDYVPT